MRVFNKLFLFLFSLTFMVVSIFTLLIGLGTIDYILLSDMIGQIYGNYNIQLALIIISAITIVTSIYLLIKSLQGKQMPSFSNRRSDIGEIRISMDTLVNLASKVASKVKGVKEQKVKVRPEEDETVTIIIKIYVDGETPIPQISDEIQLNVKENIEQIAGVLVGQVHIVVANIGQSNIKKARVE